MGKKIYEDKEAWKDILTKNYKAYSVANKLNMTDEQIEEKVNAIMSDEKRISYHKRYAAIQEKKRLQTEAYEAIKAEYEKEHGEHSFNLNGYTTFMVSKMDISGTKEANEKNKELIYRLTDRRVARKEAIKDFKRALTMDFTKFCPKNDDEAFQIYEENSEDLLMLFSIKRLLSTSGDYNLSPELTKIFNDNITMIESTASIDSMIGKYEQDATLTIPNEPIYDVAGAMDKIMINNVELAGKMDGFSVDGPIGSGSKELGTGRAFALLFNNADDAETNKVYDYLLNNKFKGNICMDYVYTQDGKELKTFDAIEKLSKGEQVNVRERTEAEKAKLLHDIDHGIADDIEVRKDHQMMKDFYQTLKNTDHWYNWNNSKQFGNLLDALKEYSEDTHRISNPKTLVESLENIKKCAEEYLSYKDGKTLNTNGQKRFDIVTNIVNSINKIETKDYFPDLGENSSMPIIDGKQQIEVDLGEEISPVEQSFTKDGPDSPERISDLTNN